MKKVVMTIQVPKQKKMKEAPEARKERLQYAQSMTTRVVPNKKKQSRNQLKQRLNRESY